MIFRKYKALLGLGLIFGFILMSACLQKKAQNEQPVYTLKMDKEVKGIRRIADSMRNVDFDTSVYLYKKMLTLAKEKNDIQGQIEAYRSLVFYPATFKNEVDSPLYYSDEALKFAHRLGDANTLCDVYGTRAVVFQLSGMYDSAIATNKLALKHMDEDQAPDSLKNWPLYLNIANFYTLLNNQQLAIEYTLKYLNEYALIKPDTNAIESSYNNLGLYYMRMSDSVRAKEYLYKSYNIVSGYPKNAIAKNKVYYNLYIYYMDVQTNFDSAYHFLNMSIESAKGFNTDAEEVQQIIGLFAIANRKKDKAMAQELLSKYFPNNYLMKEHLAFRYKNSMFYQTSLLYRLLDNDPKELEYLRISNMLAEQAAKEAEKKGMEEYELERKKVMQENVILAGELELKNKNNTILLLIIGLFILVTLVIAIWMWYRRKHELLKIENEFEAERSLLKGQIEERNRISRELHDDLGASLTSIALTGELLKIKNPEMKEDLHSISSSANEIVDTLNEIVWSLNSRNDSLQGLVAYIRKFATSYLNKVNIQTVITDTIPNEDVSVSSEIRRSVYLTSKEAINNIAKHSGATIVNIDFDWIVPQLLKIRIRDNGNSVQTESKGNSGGNGLVNMQKNMELIGGTCSFNNQSGFEVLIAVDLHKFTK